MADKGGQAPVYDLFDPFVVIAHLEDSYSWWEVFYPLKVMMGFLNQKRGGGEGDSGDIKVHVGSLKIKFWDKI